MIFEDESNIYEESFMKDVEKALRKALLQDGEMSQELYEYDIASEVDSLRRSLKKDMEDYLFCLTCNNLLNSDQPKKLRVGMLLLERKSKRTLINEAARERLKELWVGENYTRNIERFIPSFVADTLDGELIITGIKVTNTSKSSKRRSGSGFG